MNKSERKTILLLSDDMRSNSGVGTMSREIVLKTANEYNWVQVATLLQHPEQGRSLDISEAIIKEYGEKYNIEDPSVVLYPFSGYGNPDLINAIMKLHKIDAILHFTDPRYWVWLYQIEHQIRTKIPIMFYHVWDNVPFPYYNKAFYESCDYIASISMQTHNIVRNVLKYKTDKPQTPYLKYIPHGINKDYFYPIDETHPEFSELLEYKANKFPGINSSVNPFVVLYNNRNIHRKHFGDVLSAVEKLRLDTNSDNIFLIAHTHAIDQNGTDIPKVVNDCFPNLNVILSNPPVSTKELNYIYNIASVTMNLANAEGFGLGTAESLMAGTPIVATVTGGLQDQMGFMVDDDTPLSLEHFNEDFTTNSVGKYKKCGNWVQPVFPKARTLIGSVPTPYIFDDNVDFNDASEKLKVFYDMSISDPDWKKEIGKSSREYMLGYSNLNADAMGNSFKESINEFLSNWKPKQKFKLIKG